ncbi:PIN domain-containing protein [Candidatus Woesearchaeota archaeon]|mgnify:CR=1 FL=1|jgi:hypothetical protein|nr:PIN domain-containing protein [Candidatus Woesearchaeota archaeon]MBT6518328.1 PIN domain-containing protein [Candidatus Woesearchaeota archaeon]MBT7366625.1 PIN domain-containing protein [Candidatus Woesearchaeota archaeon]
MVNFYFDTCIWRDYYENRIDKFKPLGEFALLLINKIFEDGDFILYSDFVVKELQIKYSAEEIKAILDVVGSKKQLIKVNISEIQAKEAALISKQRNVAFGDALHAIISRDNFALLVTRDNHFQLLLDIVDVALPEELI